MKRLIFNDYIGKKYNRLTIVGEGEHKIRKDGGYRYCVVCKCDCGKEKNLVLSDVKSGHNMSCGCLKAENMRNVYRQFGSKKMPNNIIGKVYRKLTILSNCSNGKCLCKCSCGNVVSIFYGNIRRGATTSCGCSGKEIKDGRTKTRLYRIWQGMISRCYYKQSPHYKRYGGRGISVLWTEFEEFRKDVSISYHNHVKLYGEKNTTIDRYPNKDGNYGRENYRWATYKQQAANRNKMYTF